MAERAQPHGWLILDKPRGLGSTQAVGAVKRNLREAGYGKVKVGHGGTLDPLAEGVLPIALGEATKLCGRVLLYDKTYQFTVQFGEETDTLDTEGAVVARSDHRPTQVEAESVLNRFKGAIDQVPPAYSALKIDGQRAYDLARRGEAVEPAKRAVYISSLTSTRMRRRGSNTDEVAFYGAWDDPEVPRGEREIDAMTFIASVSKGTYVRSLARDIARAVGTFGHVTYLRRMSTGPFYRGISLDKLNEIGKGAPLDSVLRPLEDGLAGIPVLNLTPEQATMVRHGNAIAALDLSDGLYWARFGDTPLAMMDVEGGNARVRRGFNL